MSFRLGIRATAAGLELIRHFEGFRAQAYPDPLHGWGVVTIGYGTTVYSDGRCVVPGESISEPDAARELELHVLNRIHPALQGIPYIDEMSEPMIGALESFAYNLGAGLYGGVNFTTITRKLRHRDWQTMRAALLLYVNPGSSVEAGLRRRREAEAALWEQGLTEAQRLPLADPDSLP